VIDTHIVQYRQVCTYTQNNKIYCDAPTSYSSVKNKYSELPYITRRKEI